MVQIWNGLSAITYTVDGGTGGGGGWGLQLAGLGSVPPESEWLGFKCNKLLGSVHVHHIRLD